MAHPDPQVRYLDVFRFGGSLDEFIYVGTCSNVSGAQVFDIFADADIAANFQAPGDDNQPFLSTDLSQNGTCTVTSAGTGLGGTMTITAGSLFRPYDATGDAPYYLIGNQVNIDGSLYTFYRSPTSTTVVELLEDVTARAGVAWSLESPTMAHQPLPCTWGPFGGGAQGVVNFGVGDALNSGAIYWTKGNHPESHPAANSLNITSAAEPLMNGALYNGNSYVFSTLRMFVSVYPTLGGNTDFIALECPNSKGLFARWAICVTPVGIAFLNKDGIYITAGGAPGSITDEDLYVIFPHEGTSSSSFPTIDGLNGASFSPPDFTMPDQMRLAYGDGYLYFDYTDQSGAQKTLVYQFDSKCWVSRDTYAQNGISHYYERFEDNATENQNHGLVLMGTKTGDISQYSGFQDFTLPISGQIRTGSADFGDPRPRKLMGDIEIDIDSQCDTLDIEAGLEQL